MLGMRVQKKQEKMNDFRNNLGSKQFMEAHKIMIIGDEYGHNLNVILKQLLDKDMFKRLNQL